jgi:hypothetical protein
MIEVKNIFPECDSDTLLVKLITQRGNANHCHGVPKVEKAIKERAKKTNEVLIALIDSDRFKKPHENKYLFSFTEIICDKQEAAEAVILKRLPNTNSYVVFICHEFEPWIWQQAQLAQINTSEFGFRDLATVYKLSKHYRTNQDPTFKKFVNAVVLANPPGILLLRKWLVDNDFSVYND